MRRRPARTSRDRRVEKGMDSITQEKRSA
jgi:hypothetical protein